ncbi:MAG: hypothetical protein V4489_01210 [Chlamydiota bacterium]
MKDLFTQPTRARFLLAKCVVASLALHSAALYLWIKHPIFLTTCSSLFLVSTQPSIKATSEEDSPLDNSLEEFFESFFLANNQTPLNQDRPPSIEPASLLQGTKLEQMDNELSIPLCKTKLLQEALPEAPSHSPTPFALEKDNTPSLMALNFTPSSPLPLSTQKEATSYKFPTFSYDSAPLNDDFISFEENKTPLQEFSTKNEAFYSSLSKDLSLLQKSLPSTSLEEPKDFLVTTELSPFSLFELPTSFTDTTDLQNLLAHAHVAEIDDYLPTQVLYSMQWNDSFTLTPSFFADEDGYVFSLTLASKDIVQADRVKQNFYFLVDVSSGIENHKIAVFKRAVIKALSSLQPGDSFNIFLLDKKITKLSSDNLPFSFQNLRKAEEFLGKKNDRAMFASFDLFQGLDKVLDYIDSNDEVHTAVLLTSGKASTNCSNNQKALSGFLDKNKGKITLFTAAVGKNNDLVNLDMLSSLSGGKLLYSDTNASLPRKLSVFMKTLQSPLAKDIQLSIHTNDPKAEIVLLPRTSQSTHLYNKEPFVIMGRINRLADLQIALEGKNEEGWVLVSKEVDFAVAEESGVQIKREWALRQASLLYEKFLQNPKGSYLQEAKEILKMTHGRTLGE